LETRAIWSVGEGELWIRSVYTTTRKHVEANQLNVGAFLPLGRLDAYIAIV
jgi:hypothetical protein